MTASGVDANVPETQKCPPQRDANNRVGPLVSSDKPAPAERAGTRSISRSAKGACVCPSDKTASSEINLGRVGSDAFLRTLLAHVVQERVNALMIALNCRTRPVQLHE